MQPRQVARRIEARRHLALGDRAEEVVRLILLAAPDQLDRDARELLGDLGGLAGIVLGAAAPAEAAAEVEAISLALGEWNAGHLRERGERRLDVLARRPDFRLVGG